jgi:hypothetical protein
MLLYVGAWFLPALSFQRVGENNLNWRGWECAFMTLLGPLQSEFEGVANVCYPISLLLFAKRKYRPAAILSGIAVFSALQTLDLFTKEIVLDEGGVGKAVLAQLDAGFYCWISAFLIIFFQSAALVLGSLVPANTVPADKPDQTE